MKVLNLFASIGGNRKLWEDVEVTAVELDPQRAAVYQDLFPNDTVIVADAFDYLLDHYSEFDFTWCSPRCTTHTDARYIRVLGGKLKAVYPDFRLYELIRFLEKHAPGQYLVENVIAYYAALIPPQQVSRHWFWANFHITPAPTNSVSIKHHSKIGELQQALGINLDKYDIPNKRQILRDCVHPTLGKHILDCARGVQAQALLIPYTQEALI